MKPRLFWHGGVAGLRRGDEILPNMVSARCVEGCPHCEAHARGESYQGVDPPTPEDWVYGTTHRLYARYYASRAWKGDLYRIRLFGEIEKSTEDQFPTWRARRGEVAKVVERGILLTMKQRRHIFRLWGGSDLEFRGMVAAAQQSVASHEETLP